MSLVIAIAQCAAFPKKGSWNWIRLPFETISAATVTVDAVVVIPSFLFLFHILSFIFRFFLSVCVFLSLSLALISFSANRFSFSCRQLPPVQIIYIELRAPNLRDYPIRLTAKLHRHLNTKCKCWARVINYVHNYVDYLQFYVNEIGVVFLVEIIQMAHENSQFKFHINAYINIEHTDRPSIICIEGLTCGDYYYFIFFLIVWHMVGFIV